MNNNPILYNDFLGDTAKFYNSAGALIHTVNDKKKRITPTIVNNDKLIAFGAAIAANATVKGLQSLGIVYDTKSFSNFFDNNSKKFKAQSIGEYYLANASDIKMDGKSVNKNNLYAEATANTVLKNGVVTVGNNPATTNYSMNGADPYKPGNEPGKTGNIHLHPVDHTTTFSMTISDGFTGSVPSGKIYGGNPSGPDHSEYGRSGQGTRFVLVDASYIYLYNGESSQTIKIPRQ